MIFEISKIKNKKIWTEEEDKALIYYSNFYQERHWEEISKHFQNKTALQCFSRFNRIRPGIVKGKWTKEEDEQISKLVEEHGKSWSKIAKLFKTRNGKQIRDRYINVLDPNINKDKFTEEELEFIKTKRTLEDFKVGLKVPSKLMPKRIRGGVLLVNTTYEMR